MKNQFLFITLLAVSGNVLAACPGNTKTVFSCTTANNKTIQVCDAGKSISYSFGKASSPELSIAVPRNRVTTQQWNGIGRHMSYSVNIPNGNTVYSVFNTVDKFQEYSGSGVEVIQNRKLLATVKCSESKKIVNNIEGINLKNADE
ncbi:hypothetical protein CDG60_03525 [Acinetobacter chinensis]|uniref:Secreted protein n=2 Tax=Acinetobacter chinensis TaxID=2004650 RepID=A0A3B7LZK2_9GAMM|nr:hypothetical protein CDG60_03525 [Acinetobacter chinensis]